MYLSALRRISVGLALVAAFVLVLSLASSDGTNASHTPGVRTFSPTYDVLLCNALPASFSGPAELVPNAGGTETNDCPHDPNNSAEDGDDVANPGPGAPPYDCDDNIDNDADTKTDEEDDDCRATRSAALGSNPDSTTNLIWPAGNLNYSQGVLMTTTDPEWDVAAAADIPEGQVMGGLISVTTLGLAANPCSNTIVPNFIFWNASVDGVGDVVVASPEGTSDRWLTIMDDDDGFAGQADADSLIVTKYPDFLLRLFDPDGNGLFDSGSGGYDPVLPHARYAGGTQVPPGGDWQALEVLIFEPGQLQAEFLANPDNEGHPYTRMDPELGWTNITVLNDPSIVAASVSAISDFCTTLSPPLVTLGNPGGNPRLTAPSIAPGGGNGAGIDDEGTYLNRVYVMSIRDTDGDGLENALDTCPFLDNIDDPYTTSGVDADMIDPACDPTPATASKYNPANSEDGAGAGTCGDTLDNGADTKADMNDDDCHDPNLQADIDGDGYSNSQDICPLVANAPNISSETDQTINAYKDVAADGGPRGDGIGDPCDPDDADSTHSTDGKQNFVYYTRAVAGCVGGTDNDNDGWCNVGADPDGNDPNNTGSPNQDTDGDGYKDPVERYMNTDPMGDCSVTAKHQAWPPDFDNNRTINILDIVQLTPPTFGAVKGVDPEYTDRKDLNADTVINILDIVKLTPPQFGTKCKALIEVCRYTVKGDGAEHDLDVRGCRTATPNSATKPDVTLTMASLCDPAAPGNEKVKVWAKIRNHVTDGDTVTDATAKCDAGPTTSVGPLPGAGGQRSARNQSGQEPGSGAFTCSSLATDAGAAAHAFDINYAVTCKLYAD
jgi:hypothetical protein